MRRGRTRSAARQQSHPVRQGEDHRCGGGHTRCGAPRRGVEAATVELPELGHRGSVCRLGQRGKKRGACQSPSMKMNVVPSSSEGDHVAALTPQPANSKHLAGHVALFNEMGIGQGRKSTTCFSTEFKTYGNNRPQPSAVCHRSLPKLAFSRNRARRKTGDRTNARNTCHLAKGARMRSGE